MTGRSPGPGGAGRVTGVFPKSSLGSGTLVGKMGVTSGWTEGTIYGTITWYGMTAYCSTARTRGGDSGGPVWRSDGGGLRAVGITVAYNADTSNGCFIPIQDLLNEWGAWLPVFPSLAAADVPQPAAKPLPVLDPTGLIPAIGRG